MESQRGELWSRREFLGGLSVAGTAGLLGLQPVLAAAEPPPETTTIRLAQMRSICEAPQYVAEELRKGEGFADVQYVKPAASVGKTLATGEIHISVDFSAPVILDIAEGEPIVALAGVHTGCFELFGTDRIRSIRDLKGKTVGVRQLGSAGHDFLASMAAYVGLNPLRDINFVERSPVEGIRLLAEGKIDALMAFPPQPQELRAKRIARVVVNGTWDRPWSQYFCCMLFGRREFVRKHPVATKRALRAILKANQVCVLEPDRVARLLVDKGSVPGYPYGLVKYEYAVQTMKELPYAKWREYDPEDTIRFYALRLHEAGMIKASPQKIIAQGTDWRFLNELKKELKG